MNSFHSIGTLPFEDQLLFNRFGRGLTVPLAHQTVTAAFTDIVSKAPTLIAARECFGDERTITYAELDKRSNALANLLVKKHGLKPGCRVVCVYSRCVEMCIFILGVMKAGAQYVPIDGAATVDDNLKHVITDCGAAIVLCLPQFAEKVQRCMSSRSDPVVLSIGGTDALWGTGDYSPPDIPISPGDGAYVIYTSGTTGKPKGVDVTHEGTCNTLLNEPSKLGITFGTKVACVLMLGFDMCECHYSTQAQLTHPRW
jgi:acyl-CoA synthetase (AMP-forming)/AMP-acid ligase II